MSTQPTALLVLTGAFGKPLNAANVGAGVKNPDGSTNVSGTVIDVIVLETRLQCSEPKRSLDDRQGRRVEAANDNDWMLRA